MRASLYRLETDDGTGVYRRAGDEVDMHTRKCILRDIGEPGGNPYGDEVFARMYAIHPTPQRDSALIDHFLTKVEDGSYDRGYYTVPKDGVRGIYNYHFGFKSIEQLRTWFFDDELLIKLRAKGIYLATYVVEAPDDIWEEEHVYIEGNSQVMFDLEYATRVNLTELTPEELRAEAKRTR